MSRREWEKLESHKASSADDNFGITVDGQNILQSEKGKVYTDISLTAIDPCKYSFTMEEAKDNFFLNMVAGQTVHIIQQAIRIKEIKPTGDGKRYVYVAGVRNKY